MAHLDVSTWHIQTGDSSLCEACMVSVKVILYLYIVELKHERCFSAQIITKNFFSVVTSKRTTKLIIASS